MSGDKTAASSKRLYLKQTMPDDIDDAYLEMYLNTGGKNAYFRQSGKEFTKSELREFCSSGIDNDNCFYYAIHSNDDDALIGSIRIGVVDVKNSVSDMVTLVGGTKDRGKGLGTEAIKLGNRVAFDRHNIRKLHGGVLEQNTASLAAYLRAGWVVEGHLQHHYIIDGKLTNWTAISCFNPFWVVDQ